MCLKLTQGRRERGGGQGTPALPPLPPPFSGGKNFFPRKIGKHETLTCK